MEPGVDDPDVERLVERALAIDEKRTGVTREGAR